MNLTLYLNFLTYLIIGLLCSAAIVARHWYKQDQARRKVQGALRTAALRTDEQAARLPDESPPIPIAVLRQAVFSVRLAHHIMPDSPVRELQPVANAFATMAESDLLIVMTALGVPTDNVPTSLEEIRDGTGRGLLVPLELNPPPQPEGPEGPTLWERLTRHE